MTTVYFITNNYLLKTKLIYSKEQKEVKELPLSFKGEKKASELIKREELLATKTIYAANDMSSISTAKYLSEELKLPIYIDDRLKERKLGIPGTQSEDFIKTAQEQDFDYKLINGESLNMVLKRMKTCLKDILFHNEDQTVAIFTHDEALLSLFSLWCEKGFNLENQLILNYKDSVIIDGAYHLHRIFKLEFEGDKLKSMSWENEKELY